MRRLRILPMVFLLGGVAIFGFAQSKLGQIKRVSAGAEIEIRLPLFVQVVFSGGDRYLAASWAAVRALVTETSHMKPEDYQILARVQQDASWLNPAHEDNYYTAAAILPWEGQLQAAQTILRRATDARPFDYQPPFYYGFNLVQFLNDPLGAANWMRSAAQRMLDPDARLMMEDFAARWLGRSSDLELAANIVDAMAAQAKRKDFAEYLHKRSKRLRDLALLRKAAEAYTLRFGKSPGALDDLLNNGFVTTIPTDPFGIGYVIDKAGIPVILDSRKK